jgi:hypothetical protein
LLHLAARLCAGWLRRAAQPSGALKKRRTDAEIEFAAFGLTVVAPRAPEEPAR